MSDDEGDEEAGIQARAEQQRREDREHTRAVIQAVTEGHNSGRDKGTRSKYTYEKLTRGRDELELVQRSGDDPTTTHTGEVEEEEEFDEEELLQRGLQAKAERDKQSKQLSALIDTDDESYRSSDDEGDEEGENRDPSDEVDDETRLRLEEEKRKRKEQANRERIKIRQFSMQAKIRRTFRRVQNSQNSALTSATAPATTFAGAFNSLLVDNSENPHLPLIRPELLLSSPSELFPLSHTVATDHIHVKALADVSVCSYTILLYMHIVYLVPIIAVYTYLMM